MITVPFFSVEISQNVKDIKETINIYKEFRNKAKTCFKCLICQQTSVSPITMASCCKKILGCKSCVDRWLQERDICPHCRSTDIEESVVFMSAFEELRKLL